MNAPLLHQPAVRTTCPYCGVGCGLIVRRMGAAAPLITGDPDSSGEFRRALLERLGARRNARSGRATARIPMVRQLDGTLARAGLADRARPCRRRLAPHHRARRTGRRRLLSLRPVAHRGLLRRQQADEGFHRLGQCRHQFAAVHGLVGGRPSPRVRRRHGAGQLCRSRRGRSYRPGRLQCRLVPSAAVPAHAARAGRARREDRRHRSAAHRDRRGGRSFPVRSRPAPTRPCSAACSCISPTATRSIGAYIDAHTSGFADALARARAIAPDVAATAAATGLDAGDRRAILRSVPRHARASSPAISQGVNQSAQGTDKVNAIINCHLATGRIGKPGAGPFSLTGQPNAMGGREVGGLANQLAAHMGFSPREIDRVGRFWRAPRMARREGLKAVAMFEAIAAGRIKALWVMATNPAVSLPRAGAVRDALGRLELFVVSENVSLERHRECRRPRAASGRGVGREGRHGDQFGTAHLAPARVPAVARRGEARLVDRRRRWRAAWALPMRSRTARRPTSFASTRRLSAFENDGTRDFDIGGLADTLRRRDSMRSRRCNGRCARASAGDSASSRRAASSRRTARRASSRRSRRR